MRASALATLHGVAIGDALGMPTQLLSRQQVAETFGRLDGFRAATPDHPLAHGLPAGSITDDTEQTLLVARLLIDGGGSVDPAVFARALVDWEDSMRARGSLDLLGPSTKRAVDAVLAGESVGTSGRSGTTNGAAMRVSPVGIAVGSGDLGALVDAVVGVSLVSHNTGIAIAGAAAVAAAVSAGLDGASLAEATELAVAAAELGSRRGAWIAGGEVAARIRWATSLRSVDELYALVGTSLATQESVPAAFGLLALFADDPFAALCTAAGLGGDSDTVASMAGAVAGAVFGAGAWPSDAVELVTSVNALALDPIVEGLLALR